MSIRIYNRLFLKHQLIVIVLVLFVLQQEGLCIVDWELLYQPRQRSIKTIAVSKETIFLGTGNGVQVSFDGGSHWNDFGTEQLYKDVNGKAEINWISINEEEKRIYIATSFGAFYSDLQNPNWIKIFESNKTENQNINSITADNENLYLSSSDGFWVCKKDSLHCIRFNQGVKSDIVSGNHEGYYILVGDTEIISASSSGIYLLNKENKTWRDISTGIQKLPDGRVNAKYLFEDKNDNLWLACGTGTYFTNDKGKSWKNLSKGIRKNADGFQEAYYLFSNQDKLFAATASGIYFFDTQSKSWIDLNNGLRTKDANKNVYFINALEDNLLAATDEGLFVLKEAEKQESNTLTLKGKIEHEFIILEESEPSVIEVQKQALKFAALPNSNDYKRYRLQARLRNLIPQVAVDLNDTGTNTDYYQMVKGISTNTSLDNDFNSDITNRFQHDGMSFKQISFLWNTNEFIYDDEIKDILSQARLTANIRENLLDDVTKIYYQRRKLQLENISSSDLDKSLLRQIEIAELTGQLDSRTGGWFSKEIKKIKIKKGAN